MLAEFYHSPAHSRLGQLSRGQQYLAAKVVAKVCYNASLHLPLKKQYGQFMEDGEVLRDEVIKKGK